MRPAGPKKRIIALVAWGICEVFSLAVLKIAFGAGLFAGTAPFQRHLDQDLEHESPWTAPMIPHPYFGLQRDKTHAPRGWRINNYGFQSPVDYPYVKKPDEFVIGVLGGSTPEGMVEYAIRADAFAQLARKVPRLKGKRIVLLNLCLPLGRQPQQYFVSTYFSKMVDLFINLDGIWESFVMDHRYPVDFPEPYHYLYGAGKFTAAERGVIYGLRWADEWLTRAPLAFPPLAYSGIYRLGWRLVWRAKTGSVHWAEDRAGARQDPGRPFTESLSAPGTDVEALLESWSRYTVLQDMVTRHSGTKTVFMLRPSEYFYKTNPRAPRPPFFVADVTPPVETRYGALLDRGLSLKKKGILFFDLTDVFDSAPRAEFFEDHYEHLTERGKRLLARKVVNVLIDNASRIFSP